MKKLISVLCGLCILGVTLVSASDASCQAKYPETVYRTSDNACICPTSSPWGWNKYTYCSLKNGAKRIVNEAISTSTAPVAQQSNSEKDISCNAKYPGTVYRASDQMCVCPTNSPLSWNNKTHCATNHEIYTQSKINYSQPISIVTANSTVTQSSPSTREDVKIKIQDRKCKKQDSESYYDSDSKKCVNNNKPTEIKTIEIKKETTTSRGCEKYPETIYRNHDDQCICPKGNPMGWNEKSYCQNADNEIRRQYVLSWIDVHAKKNIIVNKMVSGIPEESYIIDDKTENNGIKLRKMVNLNCNDIQPQTIVDIVTQKCVCPNAAIIRNKDSYCAQNPNQEIDLSLISVTENEIRIKNNGKSNIYLDKFKIGTHWINKSLDIKPGGIQTIKHNYPLVSWYNYPDNQFPQFLCVLNENGTNEYFYYPLDKYHYECFLSIEKNEVTVSNNYFFETAIGIGEANKFISNSLERVLENGLKYNEQNSNNINGDIIDYKILPDLIITNITSDSIVIRNIGNAKASLNGFEVTNAHFNKKIEISPQSSITISHNACVDGYSIKDIGIPYMCHGSSCYLYSNIEELDFKNNSFTLPTDYESLAKSYERCDELKTIYYQDAGSGKPKITRISGYDYYKD